MADPKPPTPTPERQRTVDLLCEAFANDEIGMEEFERRVETAHAATTDEELRRLLEDLPSGGKPPERRPSGSGGQTPERPGREPGTSPARRPTRSAEGIADQNIVLGFMGGGKRKGPWTPARTNWAIGVMGGVELDFREAVLPPGVTEVKVLAFWGGAEIIVPPDVRVECSGIGIMGGFDHAQTVRCTDDPDAPVIHIGGWAVMGGIGVTVRYPGESARDARRRQKAEARSLREARTRRAELGPGPEG